MREKLIELLRQANEICGSRECEGCVGYTKRADCFNFLAADHLLANGVIVPPVKVGQTVWQTDGVRLYKSTVGEMTFTTRHTLWITEGVAFDERAIGKTVFLSKEAAKAALKGGAE